MKRSILSFLLALLLSPVAMAASINDFTDQADAFLSKYVQYGNVAYSKIKQNQAEIDALYTLIGEVDLSTASDQEAKAFYINAYNLIVIHDIVKYYPLKSALDQNGFFDKKKHLVAGQSLTLDQIEKGKVILKYKDPRVHFAFSCAAKGCPKLASYAYRATMLDEQLNRRTRQVVQDLKFIWFDLENRSVYISKIFDWYERDFTQDGQTVVEWINQYRNKEIPGHFTVIHYDYDWALNDLL